MEKIATEYNNWVQSSPFDMGITIGSTIGCVLKGEHNNAFKKHIQKVGYANGTTLYSHCGSVKDID